MWLTIQPAQGNKQLKAINNSIKYTEKSREYIIGTQKRNPKFMYWDGVFYKMSTRSNNIKETPVKFTNFNICKFNIKCVYQALEIWNYKAIMKLTFFLYFRENVSYF